MRPTYLVVLMEKLRLRLRRRLSYSYDLADQGIWLVSWPIALGLLSPVGVTVSS